MMTRHALICLTLGVMAAALLSEAAVCSQDLINRRDQFRGAFKASPARLYAHYCAHCHGDDAKGSGRLWVTELSPKPSDLTASSLDGEAMVGFITNGSAASGRSSFCPPWGRTLSEADIRRLTWHLQSLGSKEIAPVAAKGTPSNWAGQPFPWVLLGLLVLEVAALLMMLVVKRRKQSA